MTLAPPIEPGFAPQLELGFARRRDGATTLARRKVVYPFAVMAPVGRALPQVFIQSTSGGFFAGERVALAIEAEAGAAVRVEQPAAMVVHPMRDGRDARQELTLVAGAGAVLQFRPRPLILFPESELTQETRLVVGEGARLLASDGFLLHDPARTGLAFRRLRTGLTIADPAGRILARDRSLVTGAAIQAGDAGPHRAFGTVIAIGPGLAGLTVPTPPETYLGAGPLARVPGVLVRIGARDGGALAVALQAVNDFLASHLHQEGGGPG